MTQALVAFLLLVLAGAIAAVSGAFILAGPGWALLVLALICFAAAGFVKFGSTQAPA